MEDGPSREPNRAADVVEKAEELAQRGELREGLALLESLDTSAFSPGETAAASRIRAREHLASGDIEAAVVQFHEGLLGLRTNAQGNQIGALIELSVALDSASSLLLESGAKDEALSFALEALEYDRSSYAANPDDEATWHLARGIERVAEVHGKLERWEAARSLCWEALALRRGMVESAKTHENWGSLRDLLEQLAASHRHLMQFPEAVQCASEATDLSRQLFLESPTPKHRKDILHSLERLDEHLHNNGEVDKSLAVVQEAVVLAREWVEQEGSIASQIALIDALHDLRSCQYWLDRPDQEILACEEAVRLARMVAGLHPSLKHSLLLCDALDELSDAYERVERYLEGRPLREEALALLGRLRELNRSTSIDHRYHRALDELADNCEFTDDLNAALACQMKLMRTMPQIPESLSDISSRFWEPLIASVRLGSELKNADALEECKSTALSLWQEIQNRRNSPWEGRAAVLERLSLICIQLNLRDLSRELVSMVVEGWLEEPRPEESWIAWGRAVDLGRYAVGLNEHGWATDVDTIVSLARNLLEEHVPDPGEPDPYLTYSDALRKWGRSLMKLGRRGEAALVHRAALEAARREGARVRLERISSCDTSILLDLSRLAWNFTGLEDFETAEALYQESLDMARLFAEAEAHFPFHYWVSGASADLGYFLLSRHRYGDALPNLEEAVFHRKQLDRWSIIDNPKELVADTWGNIGECHQGLGRSSEAAGAYEKRLEQLRELLLFHRAPWCRRAMLLTLSDLLSCSQTPGEKQPVVDEALVLCEEDILGHYRRYSDCEVLAAMSHLAEEAVSLNRKDDALKFAQASMPLASRAIWRDRARADFSGLQGSLARIVLVIEASQQDWIQADYWDQAKGDLRSLGQRAALALEHSEDDVAIQ